MGSAPSAADLKQLKEEAAQDKQLRSLVSALKKHSDALPEELQNVLQEVTSKSGQQETKLLHSAVTAHGRAKKDLQEAQIERANLHTAWRKFLSQSAEQWQKYSEMFQQQEQAVTAKVQQAKDSLKAAKETLSNTKIAAGVESKEETSHMSDVEDLEKDLATATATKITEGFTQLSEGLQTLQQQAEQAELEEQKAMKRQRLSPPEKEADGSTNAATTPYGGPA